MKDSPKAPGHSGNWSREDEADLVGRIRTKDRDAFAALVDRHHSSLVRLAALFVSTRASAEEVAQETWLAALDGIGRFEGRSSFKTWLFRIAVNRAKTRAVKEGRSLPFSSVGTGEPDADVSPLEGRFDASGKWSDPPTPWHVKDPEDLLASIEATSALSAAIAELPPSYRAIVTMRDLEELSSGEVCNVLEISETNQRVLLHRARSRLRRALEKHFRGT